MKDLAQLTVGGTPFPIPTVIQPIFGMAGDFGQNILVFGVYVMIAVVIVLALVFIIWGGISWVISGGEKTKLQSARNTVRFALLGLIIERTAFSLVIFISPLFLG